MTWRDHDTASSHWIASSDVRGLKLHLRARGDGDRPVLFVHGATYASRLYDIPHPGASWLADVARHGFAGYALDIRGYGLSHAEDMERSGAPYAAAADAVKDIADAVDWICARHGVDRLRLIGGSWGSITTALYTAGPGAAQVERLVLYAPIFAEANAGWRALLADPDHPDRFNPALGPARLVSEEATRARWDAEIPDGAAWRDEAVFQALVQSSLADDPQSYRHDTPAFRAPNGTLTDLWQAFRGVALYDPTRIKCPTLLIRGAADPTSTRSDALRLFDRLGGEHRQYVEIANGAHFVSAERKSAQVFDHAATFLNAVF